jgi:hypothetical protein
MRSLRVSLLLPFALAFAFFASFDWRSFFASLLQPLAPLHSAHAITKQL